MQILVDADMVLEALLNRSGFVGDSEDLLDILQIQQIQGYISELGLEKIYSVVSRLESPEVAEEVVSEIQAIMLLCSVGSKRSKLLQKARSLNIRDFESAVEVACATAMNIGAIITQEPQNFVGADLPVLSVGNLLKRQYLERSWTTNTSPVLLVSDLLEIQRLEEPLNKSQSLEAEDPLKYRIRNSIATILEAFKILQEEGSQGLSRQQIAIKANYSDSKVYNIIWDLRNFKLATLKEDKIIANRHLVNSGNVEIANHLARILKQHIVTREIYRDFKPQEILNRGYFKKLIKKVYPKEKYVNTKLGKEYKSQEHFQPLLFDIRPSKRTIATKSVGDYTSRMLGWFFFTGLLEYRSKEVIVIPSGQGKQKGKLVEETEAQQLELFNNY